MENLTNEQIVDIINFYESCGITEDMYLSRNGVLDLFTLLGISPEYDDNGNRLPTVYEQISIAPIFRNGCEVPIVFAIKHKVDKINRNPKVDNTTFSYVPDKELSDEKEILNSLKRDYFSSLLNGNLVEATRLYDMIDALTGGEADEFIGIQYNCVKFYKKMQQQLLIDMFANFIILMILSKKDGLQTGVLKFDKLYKAFVQKELEQGGFGLSSGVSFPKLSNITVSINDDNDSKKVTVKTSAKVAGKTQKLVVKEYIEPEVEKPQDIISFIKSKINMRVNKIKDAFESKNKIADAKRSLDSRNEDCLNASEKQAKILEND